MNSNFVLSVNIVLPCFCLMGVGYLARRIKLLDPETTRVMNGLIFRLFLPVYLVRSIMRANIENLTNPRVFLFIGIAMSAVYLICFALIPRIEKNPLKRGVMIQAIGRSNYALFGIPLVAAIFPGADTSLASLLVVVNIPLTNAFSVYALESSRSARPSFKQIFNGIITNPLIISSVIGLLLLLIQPPLPAFLGTALDDLSKIATPLALFLLGASIDFGKVGSNIKQILIAVSGRLVVVPVIVLSIAVALGFRRIELACILVSFAAPTAVNSYTMALMLGVDAELAAECVVFSTGFSIVTVFAFVYTLMRMGYLV